MNTTELRVPGIGRWSPERILRQPVVRKVAGDGDAGFFRPEGGLRATGRNVVSLETYSWGGLTGGKAIRTLSLVLLLPFMLSNTAIWMLPPAPAGSAALARAICRLLAATLTLMYVLSIVGVAIDLVAWQCAGDPHCADDRWMLSWLADLQPGQRVALAALVPIVAVGLMWWLGGRGGRLPEGAPATAAREGLGALLLDAPQFWDSRILLRRLTLLHVAIALGAVDVVLLAAVAPHDGRTTGFGLLALTVIVMVAAVALLCHPARPLRHADRRIAWAVRGVWVAMLAVTASTLGYAALPRLEWDPGAELPGYGPLVAWLYAAQAVLMLLLGVIVVRQRRQITSPSIVGGFGAPVIVAFAVGVGVAFSSALLYTASYYLDRNVDPRPRRLLPTGVPPLLPPVAYRWAALGFFVAAVVTALAALLRSQLTLRQRRRRAVEILRHDFPDAPLQPHPRIRAVRDAIVRAQLTDRSWPLPVAYAVVFVLILGSAGLSLAGIGPRDLALRIGGEPAARSAVLLSHLGTNVTGLFAVAMAVAALLTHRSKGLHRIGVLWDLATFWPRTAHPLAPPCYAERAVPELTRRIECLTRRGGTVVLSGHSQGAVLVAATILHLQLPCLERVALLTHANPLRRLYSKIFPAHLGPSALRDVGERVGWRWLNLWRDTDPIGAWVFSCGPDSPAHGTGRPRCGDRTDGVDRRCRDPHSLLTAPEDPAPPPIQGHRFDPDSDYEAAVRDLVARLPAA